MSDYPTFLQVGTEISAKFKGAFCEAKIKKAARCVRCRVVFKDNQIPSTFLDENAIRGSIRLGLSVEAPHPDTKQMISATIQQIKDCSTYTVVFDDGDEKVLRRSQMCLKGGRHFDESESLDVMPLTKPEQFGAPVRSKMNKKLKANNTSDSDSDLSGPNSAVEKKSFERRSTRQTPIHSSPASSAANSSSSSQADFGRVVCVFEEAPLSTGSNKTGAQEKRRWYPAMIVSPSSQQGTKLKSRDEHLIRNFKDGKYQVVSRSSVQDFNIDKAKKNELASLKPAIEKAILYLEEDQLPVNWDREVLMGDARLSEDSSSEDSASDEEASNRKIVSEKKDRFVAQLYKYMDELGTPINKAPVLAQKDLDLYRLFESVRKLGGYNRVCLKNEWKTVLKKLKLDGLPGATAQAVKSAFNKYLSQFESFYRKKASQSDDVSRRESQASKAASRLSDKMIENEMKSKEEVAGRKPSAQKRTTAHKISTDAAQKGSSDNESQIFPGKQSKSAEYQPEAESSSIEDQSDTTIKRETEEFKIGQKLRVQYGFGTLRKIYMAKVVKVEGPDKYLVHYLGWNNRYDEIINSSRVVEILPEEPSDSEQPSGPPRFAKSHRGQKPSSMGRGERKMAPYARKRRSSGGSTHSLPFEPCGKMSPMTKKMKNLKNYSTKKEPSDVDSPKSTKTNGGGRRSNTSTPVPQIVSAFAVDEPKQRRKIQKASDDDSNEDSEETIAVTTRRSKRIRGEKPCESAPKNSPASAALKGDPSNDDTPEEAQEPAEQSPPVVDGQEGVAEASVDEQLQTFDFLPASSVVEPETPKIEIVNEIKLIEDALIEEFTVEEKVAPVLNVVQKEKITASQSSKRSAAGGPARKQKAKRRKRNYSHMVTEYRKTKHTPKKECDSDNDATKFEGSPKDVSSLHALRQKVQQEMDSDPNYKPFYTFNVIDDNLKGEKKIQILQQRLIDLKEAYAQVKSEWTYLERKRKKHLEKKRKQNQRKRPSADSNEESRKISYDSNETASKTESANKPSLDV